MSSQSSQNGAFYEFGPFRLDPAERKLLRDGQPVTLTPKAFETLVVLVERKGRLVGKDELMRALWPETVVEEANLTNSVYALRKALGGGQSYIETVPKHGYRFVAEVRSVTETGRDIGGDALLVVEKHTHTHTVIEDEVSEATHESIEATLVSAPKQFATVIAERRPARLMLPLALALLSLSAIAALTFVYRPWNSGVTRRTAAETAGAAQVGRPPRTIAVLPFKTIGNVDGDEEYLGMGMTDALITRLGHSRQIVVRPTSAVRRYANPRQDPRAAGREQAVETVLDGSIQRAGDRIRVTVQLINVAGGESIWSEKFDEPFTDIFAVQDSISRRVMRDLLVELSTEEKARLNRRGSESAEAYQEYLRGRYFWNKRTIEGYEKAFEHFNRALDLDPAYAQAYAGLADAILYRRINAATQKESQEALDKGRAALRKALEIDETLAEPHATLGLLAMNVDSDWPEAERDFKRAIELNPNYATAHQWHGEFLAYMGRFDEAVVEIKRAQEMDPLSLIIATDVAKVYTLARRYDEAITQYKRVLEMDPNFAEAHGLLGLAYSLKGRHEEAIAELHTIRELENHQIYLSWMGYVYGQAGKKDEGRKTLSRLENLSRRTNVSPLWMAVIHTGLGDKEQAFAWLERAFAERADSGALTLKVNPIFDSLRSDPRYADLLRRANFTH